MLLGRNAINTWGEFDLITKEKGGGYNKIGK